MKSNEHSDMINNVLFGFGLGLCFSSWIIGLTLIILTLIFYMAGAK